MSEELRAELKRLRMLAESLETRLHVQLTTQRTLMNELWAVYELLVKCEKALVESQRPR